MEGELMEESIEKTLNERGLIHGNFERCAETAQRLKHIVKAQRGLKPHKTAPVILEGIDNICQKLTRIACGDEEFKDHWVDIAGYATLVANHLEESSGRTVKR